MLEGILLATDLTLASERALDLAAGLSRSLRARLTVVHVYAVSPSTLAGTPPAVAERTWPGGVRARAALDAVAERLRARGLRVESSLRFGAVREQIVEAAIESGSGLIVTGTHARKGLARLWHVSVAEEVVRHSPVPVLAVPASPARVIRLDRGTPGRRAATLAPIHLPEP